MPSKLPSNLRRSLYDAGVIRRYRWRRFPGVERLPGAAPHIALTFDDGPHPDSTPLLLELLAELGQKATFFVLGKQVRRYQALARDIASSGHVLGLHGSTHFRHDRATEDESREDIRLGRFELADVTGIEPTLYRPPYGKFSKVAYETCRELALSPVYWSVTGHDWEDVSANHIAGRVNRGLSKGAIVLLHDTAVWGQRRSARATIDALPAVDSEMRRRGLHAVTLEETLGGAGRA